MIRGSPIPRGGASIMPRRRYFTRTASGFAGIIDPPAFRYPRFRLRPRTGRCSAITGILTSGSWMSWTVARASEGPRPSARCAGWAPARSRPGRPRWSSSPPYRPGCFPTWPAPCRDTPSIKGLRFWPVNWEHRSPAPWSRFMMTEPLGADWDRGPSTGRGFPPSGGRSWSAGS